MFRLTPLALALALALGSAAASAQQRDAYEVLRNTTLNLIRALVEKGILTREQADELIRDAERKAIDQAAAREGDLPPPPPSDDTMRAQPPQPGAVATPPSGAATPSATGTVRVPYIPESVKRDLRESIKKEVMQQARDEHWAEPKAVPEWTKRIRIDGDIRTRFQFDDYAKDNTKPQDYVDAAFLREATRAPDFGATTNKDVGSPTGNTTEDLDRFRLRVRLGITATITDWVSVGLRFATGNTSDRVSTNQTLGQNANKYSFLVDRAFTKLNFSDTVSGTVGRMQNPWFGSEMMWDEDLNFEGLSAKYESRDERFAPFATLGYFPLREKRPHAYSQSRWLSGAQAGAMANFNPRTQFKFGVAMYQFHNVEGRKESDAAFNTVSSAPFDAATYLSGEYEAGFRQKGNTLFALNASNDSAYPTTWGLASKMRPISIDASLDLAHFEPFHLMWQNSYIRNLAFNRNEIRNRTGLDLQDGRNQGYQTRLAFGAQAPANQGEWQVYGAYRYIGSDATLDAFVDSDFGLGGTNLRGYIFGGVYAIARNTLVGMKYLSARTIDPTILSTTSTSSSKFGVSSIQADLNVRF